MDRKSPLGLRLIAGAKIAKGVTLACLSLGVFDVIHKDLSGIALHVVRIARISPENRFVTLVLGKLDVVQPATLVRLGILSAVYASVLLLEGLGLWFGASWAEYLVVVSSGIFVPEEYLTTVNHFSWLKLTILLLNTLVLVYVAKLVWERFKERRAKAPKSPGATPA